MFVSIYSINFMVKKILQYSLIVILSTIAGLYLFIIFQKGKEILIFKYKKDTFFLENKKPFDDREKKEVYLDLKKTYPKINFLDQIWAPGGPGFPWGHLAGRKLKFYFV